VTSAVNGDGSDILDLVHESILVRDADGCILSWNKASEALYGWPRAQAIGRAAQELLATEYPGAAADVERQLLEQNVWDGELVRTTASGAKVTIEARWTVRRDASGAVRDVVESGRDITARKKAEERLRYSEHRYTNLFGAMAASFWEIDFSAITPMMRALRKSGVEDFRAYFKAHPEFVREMMTNSRVIDVNDETVKLFGRGNKDEILTSVEPFWPEESTHVYAEAILQSVIGKPNYSTECKLRRIDGSLFDGLFTAAFPPETFGKGTLVVGVIDITERRQALARLERSQQRYRSLFQATTVSFFEVDFTGVGDVIQRLREAGVDDFRQHFRDNPDAVHQVMLATRIVDVNDRTVSLFRIEQREHLTTEPFWPKESWQDYAGAIVSSLEHQLNYSVETRLRRFDGTIFDAEFTVWYSAENRSIGLAGVLDITERRRAFNELERSEERYRNLFQYMPMSLTQIDTSRLVPIYRSLRQQGISDLAPYLDANPDFLWTITDAMVIDEVNDHNARMFGAPDQTAMHGPITRYWSARPDSIRRALVSLYRGDLSFQEETQVVRFDGTTIDVLFSVARPAPVSDKSLVGFLDITELKQAHREVERSEVRYRSLFHHIPIPLWRMNSTALLAEMDILHQQGVTDLMGYIGANPGFVRHAMDLIQVEEVNRSTAELFGASDPGELLGSVAKYWTVDVDQFAHILDARYRGEHSHTQSVRLATFDGRMLEGVFVAAFPPELSALGISLNAFVDSTDRVKAEEMLRKVQSEFAHAARVSMLGELTASIAHEVNQPLAAITTNGEAGLRWLTRAVPDVDEARNLMKRMVADARRAADVISRVRSMATRSAHTRVPISLHLVIDETLLFVGHEMQSRRVTITRQNAHRLPDVLADRTQMQQVLVNLAVNAVQAMAHGGDGPRALTIRTALTERSEVCCIIEDSGPGIDEAHLGRLFESFFTTKEGGMGMGLAICRSIIEAHGGRIAADNGSAMGGARFTFTLPSAEAASRLN
jgi:PAS domain S-box-containing protein